MKNVPKLVTILWSLVLPVGSAVALVLFAWLSPATYEVLVWTEYSALERGQFLLLLGGLAVSIDMWMRRRKGRERVVRVWIGLAVLGCLFTAGEEVSWGQHLFHWETPELFTRLNAQNQTELHNTSRLFDQLPRGLLEAAIILGGIVFPILIRFRPAIAHSSKTACSAGSGSKGSRSECSCGERRTAAGDGADVRPARIDRGLRRT